METICNKCSGSGVVNNRVCSCQLKKIFKNQYPELVPIETNNNFLASLKTDDNSHRFLSFKDLNTNSIKQIITTYVLYHMVKGKSSYKYQTSNDMLIQDLIFSDDQTVSELLKPDLLIYQLQGTRHKAIPDSLIALLEERHNRGSSTWLTYSNKSIEGQIGSIYSVELHSFIRKNFTIIE